MSTAQLSTIFVVLLTDILLHGDWVHKDTVLEVERPLRNDWKGSGICRDATEEEIAEALAERGDGQDDADQVQRRDDLIAAALALEGEVANLQERKAELAGDLKALESALEELGNLRAGLQGQVDDLVDKQKKLADEVAALEKAKKAAK
jgi:chromosome segregation ATPase